MPVGIYDVSGGEASIEIYASADLESFCRQ